MLDNKAFFYVELYLVFFGFIISLIVFFNLFLSVDFCHDDVLDSVIKSQEQYDELYYNSLIATENKIIDANVICSNKIVIERYLFIAKEHKKYYLEYCYD